MLAIVKKGKVWYHCSCGVGHEATMAGWSKEARVIISHPCLGCDKQLYVKVQGEDIMMAEGELASIVPIGVPERP